MKEQISGWEWLCRKFGKTAQTVDEEIMEESLLLERNVLEHELMLIKKEHELAGKRAQLAHLSAWLAKRAEK